MKTKKLFTNRILSLVLAVVMVLGMVPMAAYAATSGTCGDGVNFTIDNGTLTITGSGAVREEAGYYNWKAERDNITKIVIGKDVTLPNHTSFGYHSKLTAVEYDGTVTAIQGFNLFIACGELSSFTLREGVGRSTNAFSGCMKLNGAGIKLVDAKGSDKTSFYIVSVEANSAYYNYMTVKGNLEKGSIESIPDQQYTGGEVKPAVTVTWNGQTVASGNYNVSYSNNTGPGVATVTISGKNYYTGTLTQTFTILEPVDMTGVSAQNVTAIYDGNAHGITVTGTPDDATITYSSVEDGTYTAAQPAIVNVADSGMIYYKVNAPGYWGFNGSASVTISPRNITDCQVQDIAAQTYTGSVITPDVTMTYGSNTLTQDDYSISGDSVNVGAGSATITGKGNFAGTTTKDFQITSANIADATVTLDPENGTYNGGAYTPSVTVAFNGAPLIKDTDYTLSWDKSGLTDQGTYTVRVVGIGNFTGFADKTFTINAADLSTVKVEQSGTLTYDGGNALTPTVSANAVAVNNQPISFTYSTLQDGTYGSMPSFIKAGTYTVYYKATAPNHNEAKGSFTVTVEKAVPVYTAPAAKENLSYNGGEQELIVAGSTNGGQMQYSLDDTNYSNTIPEGKLPGDYTVYYRIVGNDNYKDVAPQTLTVKIDKCKQTAPESLTKTDETISKKSDGSISGITSDMEWRKAGETTYVIVTNEKYENLAAGTYYMRYQGNENYHPSPDAEIVIAAGRKLKINAPENQVGYTLTSDVCEVDYLGNATLTFALKEGYSKDDNFKIILNGNPDAQWLNGQLPLSGIYTDVNIVVEGVVDNTAPTAEIKVKDNGWTEFLNSITFGLFFKETQDVTITAADAGSGVKSIEYYLANAELSLAEVEAITSWKGYDEAFKVDPDNEYVIYVKVTDNDGNVCYISSNGIVLDATAPVISGVENGNTYYTTQKVTVTEKNVASIQLNGETAGSDITLEGNKNATYTIIVTDKAGNVTSVTVTMKPISDLVAPIAALNKDSVNSENEQTVDGVKAAVAAVDTTNATEQEKAALKGISDKVAELEKAIDEAKASSEEQNKTNSPATGDTSNLGLWVALFFISCSAVLTLIVVDRKRRMIGK